MLRQLHLRVLELELGSENDALERYKERLEVVIMIAEERGKADIAATLASLHRRLSGLQSGYSARGNLSEMVNRHLTGAMAMLVLDGRCMRRARTALSAQGSL